MFPRDVGKRGGTIQYLHCKRDVTSQIPTRGFWKRYQQRTRCLLQVKSRRILWGSPRTFRTLGSDSQRLRLLLGMRHKGYSAFILWPSGVRVTLSATCNHQNTCGCQVILGAICFRDCYEISRLELRMGRRDQVYTKTQCRGVTPLGSPAVLQSISFCGK